jgi:hypothetical protein
MFERLLKLVLILTCHRATYGGLFVTYLAFTIGVIDKATLGGACAGLYLLLFARG